MHFGARETARAMHSVRVMTSKSLFLVFATTLLLAGCATAEASPGAVETLRVMRERGPCHVHVSDHDIAGCRTAT